MKSAYSVTTAQEGEGTDAASDPLRPADHVDGVGAATFGGEDSGVQQPRLSAAGYARFFWRQLTSMRTALFLLMLLALAAVPGSLVPQRGADPNGVVQYKVNHPSLYPILDKLQLFDTYTSVWFSAIYLLLFVSLIGCILPRTKHHWVALRSRPPRTPGRLERLVGFRRLHVDSDTASGGLSADAAIRTAMRQLRRSGYRVARFGDSVSAERGYLRETGNLLFHAALVGVLIAVGVGGGFGYTGQRLLIQGQSFTNVLGSYDSFNPGRWFDQSRLAPYSLTLKQFTTTYETRNLNALGLPINYSGTVIERTPTTPAVSKHLAVNAPLSIGGTNVYLLGNGYAMDVTVRDGRGHTAFQDVVPFLPQDSNMTSLGVIKVPDAAPQQLGFVGFFYPTAAKLTTGADTSSYPDIENPTLSLQVYTGNLGLNNGVPKSVYQLSTAGLTQIAGPKAKNGSVELKPGQTKILPDGAGSITFNGIKRYISVDIHHDPSQIWVAVFTILAVAGLLTSLFIPRRRVWVKVVRRGSAEDDGSYDLEYAGLARGEDPNLDRAVGAIATQHGTALGARSPE